MCPAAQAGVTSEGSFAWHPGTTEVASSPSVSSLGEEFPTRIPKTPGPAPCAQLCEVLSVEVDSLRL